MGVNFGQIGVGGKTHSQLPIKWGGIEESKKKVVKSNRLRKMV